MAVAAVVMIAVVIATILAPVMTMVAGMATSRCIQGVDLHSAHVHRATFGPRTKSESSDNRSYRRRAQ
jgi:hypothetical protein